MSPLSDAIQQSEFKIRWAKIHISQAERFVADIIKPAPDLIDTQYNPQTRECFINIGPRDGLPIELFLHIGDAIHALNSCLDYLWSGLTRSVVPTDKRATFPRHETRENLEQMIAGSPIRQAFPKIEPFILDEVRPYKDPLETGNFFIWALNRLDNTLKHRLIIVTPAIIKFGKFIVNGSNGGKLDMSYSVVKTYGPVLKLGVTGPATLDYDSETAVDVVFVEDNLFTGEPVVKTLVNLTEAVTKTRQLFIETFAT